MMSGATDMPAAPPAGSARWYAWLFTPSHARTTAALLFALESELRSVFVARVDHGVAHLKLRWWREEIQRLMQGAPRHPLTISLAAAAPNAAYAWNPLDDFLTSLELELAEVAIDDETELDRFLALADGLTRTLALALAGKFADAATLEIGSGVGQAVRGAQIVACWCGTPLDESQRSAALRLAARSRACWEKAIPLFRYPEYEALRGLRVLGQLHMAMLDRIQSEHFRLERRRPELSAMQSLWTAWRAARQH